MGVAPSRGRGLKQERTKPELLAVTVAPSRGRGLKLMVLLLRQRRNSRPFTGAWIETRP